MSARTKTGRRRNAGVERTSLSAPAYLTRKIPPYVLLDEAALDQVEAQADWILKEVGIEFRGDEEALRLFREAGCDVQGERVRFETGQVRKLAATAPREFVQHARNPARSVHLGGKHTVFASMYGAPFVRDLEGGRRYASLEDYHKICKLIQMQPNLHHLGHVVCEPVDIPVSERHLHMLHALATLSDKPFFGAVTRPERAQDSVDFARALFGAERLARECCILGSINVNSPLFYDGDISGSMRAYAGAGQGMAIIPFILGGAMGPVTLAASLAQAHAEAMAGVALIQLVHPGAPVIYGNFFTTMNLRSGAPTFGMPEAFMAYVAVGQLARRVGLPVRVGGQFTASKVADAQALQESADSMTPAILGHANFVLHSAGWLEGGLTFGYEKFILDAERLGALAVLYEGMPINEDHLGSAAFSEVGPGGHFLGSAHTLKHYQTAFYEYRTADSASFEQWKDEGSLTAEQRANRIWKADLEAYEPPPMDEAKREELDAFVKKRCEEIPERWY